MIVVLGASCLGVVVCNSSIGKWFIRKRGLAIGTASVGIGVGTMAMAPLAGYVVKVYGWQAGFVMMGAAVLLIGVILSQWLMGKNRPEDYGLEPDGGDRTEEPTSGRTLGGGSRVPPSLRFVLRDSRFWIYCHDDALPGGRPVRKVRSGLRLRSADLFLGRHPRQRRPV